MNQEVILRLLKSSNKEDFLIGVTLILDYSEKEIIDFFEKNCDFLNEEMKKRPKEWICPNGITHSLEAAFQFYAREDKAIYFTGNIYYTRMSMVGSKFSKYITYL